MIENFLRLPRGAAEVVADLLRVVGAIGVLVAAIAFGPTDAGVLAFVLPALLLPRFLGARHAFDIVAVLILLIAGWSNVLDLYTRIDWWDIAVHVSCTAVLAALVYLLLAQLEVVPDARAPRTSPATPIVLTTTLGLALSAIWEMVEWIGKTFISAEIFVEYNDTIGDMAVGGLGALAAGVLLARVRLTRRS